MNIPNIKSMRHIEAVKKIGAFFIIFAIIFLITFFCLPGVSFTIDGKNKEHNSALGKLGDNDLKSDADLFLRNRAIQATIITVLVMMIISTQLFHQFFNVSKYGNYIQFLINSIIMSMIIFLIISPISFLQDAKKYRETEFYKNNKDNVGGNIAHIAIIAASSALVLFITRLVVDKKFRSAAVVKMGEMKNAAAAKMGEMKNNIQNKYADFQQKREEKKIENAKQLLSSHPQSTETQPLIKQQFN